MRGSAVATRAIGLSRSRSCSPPAARRRPTRRRYPTPAPAASLEDAPAAVDRLPRRLGGRRLRGHVRACWRRRTRPGVSGGGLHGPAPSHSRPDAGHRGLTRMTARPSASPCRPHRARRTCRRPPPLAGTACRSRPDPPARQPALDTPAPVLHGPVPALGRPARWPRLTTDLFGDVRLDRTAAPDPGRGRLAGPLEPGAAVPGARRRRRPSAPARACRRAARIVGPDGTVFAATREDGVRVYPQEWLAGQTIGYVSPVTPDDLTTLAAKGYRPVMWLAAAGSSMAPRTLLRGTPGFDAVRRCPAERRPVAVLQTEAWCPGADVTITVAARPPGDRRAGHRRPQRRRAPRSSTRAAATCGRSPSAPAFNPNAMTLGTHPARRAARRSVRTPRSSNNAVLGAYPAGSSFKPFTLAAALKTGVASRPRACPARGTWTYSRLHVPQLHGAHAPGLRRPAAGHGLQLQHDLHAALDPRLSSRTQTRPHRPGARVRLRPVRPASGTSPRSRASCPTHAYFAKRHARRRQDPPVRRLRPDPAGDRPGAATSARRCSSPTPTPRSATAARSGRRGIVATATPARRHAWSSATSRRCTRRISLKRRAARLRRPVAARRRRPTRTAPAPPPSPASASGGRQERHGRDGTPDPHACSRLRAGRRPAHRGRHGPRLRPARHRRLDSAPLVRQVMARSSPAGERPRRASGLGRGSAAGSIGLPLLRPDQICSTLASAGNRWRSAARTSVISENAIPLRFQTAEVGVDWLQCNIECQEGCPVNTNCRGYLMLAAEGRFEEGYILARDPNPVAAICGYVCSAAVREGLPPGRHRQAARHPRHEALPGRLALRQQHAGHDRASAPPPARASRSSAPGRPASRVAKDLATYGHEVHVYEALPVGRRHDPDRRAGLPAAARRHRARRELGRQARRRVPLQRRDRARHHPRPAAASATTPSWSATGCMYPGRHERARRGDRRRHLRRRLPEARQPRPGAVGRRARRGRGRRLHRDGLLAHRPAARAPRPAPSSTAAARRRWWSTRRSSTRPASRACRFEFFASPVEVAADENGKVTGMVFQRTRLGPPDATGRRSARSRSPAASSPSPATWSSRAPARRPTTTCSASSARS